MGDVREVQPAQADFVTNMDDDHASYRELVVKLETKFGRKIAPFQLPIRENEKFVGFVNVVKMGGRRFTHLSDYEECEIPDYVQKNLTIARDALIEAVAETSEEYMERYFLGEEFTQEEISTALRTHVIEGDIVPVMMGSGINCQALRFCCRPLTNTSRHLIILSVSAWMFPQASALPPNTTTMCPCPPECSRPSWTHSSASIH